MLPARATAEDTGDSFILPETPPTIERKKIPPLDRPLMQKQDFISDSEIEIPFIWQNRDFIGYGAQKDFTRIGLSKGSFSSSGGSFLFASGDGSRFDYSIYRTEGESAKLSEEINKLSYDWEKIGSGNIFGNFGFAASDSRVWVQKHKEYSAHSSVFWYPAENLNAKLTVKGDSSEIAEMQFNDNIGADVSLECSPFDGHTALLESSAQRDTAFIKIKDFSESRISYSVLMFDSLSVKGGARFQKNESFPLGGVAWNFLPRTRISFDYKAGSEKPAWDGLYMRRNFLKTNQDLALPKAVRSLTGTFSYYYQDVISAKVRVDQSEWKDYICWEHLPGTDYIAPGNVKDAKTTSAEASFAYRHGIFGVKTSVTQNSATELPFVPGSKVQFDAEFYLPGSWTLGTGCGVVSEQKTTIAGPDKLDSYTGVSASVNKEFPGGVVLYSRVDNLLENVKETQPGFVSKSAEFQCGLTVMF
ncbi:MAG: hypothetical protein ABII64_01035 [Elusimicrobiota bacterium]